MQDGTLLGIISMIVSIGGIVLGIINHKRLRSKCCGRNLEASIDIENTTPPQIPKLTLPPSATAVELPKS